MSFQAEKLPAPLIVDLYKSTLVLDQEIKTNKDAGNPVKKTGIDFKGKNGKSVAVLVCCRQKFSETSSEILFLLKILRACNLGIEDIALIDVMGVSMSLEDFVTDFKPSRVLLFSSTLNKTDIPKSLCFEIEKVGNAEVVYAPEVHTMQSEGNEAVQLKKKLWIVLKHFFNV
ncbi:MAG: hypothetical protein ABI151_01905 [Chitinophagaceae bacterium]